MTVVIVLFVLANIAYFSALSFAEIIHSSTIGLVGFNSNLRVQISTITHVRYRPSANTFSGVPVARCTP
jgi:hypothetical protein